MGRYSTEELKPETLDLFLRTKREVLLDVQNERNKQNNKWGWQRHNHGHWLAILGEEYGEVCQAICSKTFAAKDTDKDDLYYELIQVAAVAVAFAEQVKQEKEVGIDFSVGGF